MEDIPSTRSAKILLADDEKTTRELLARALEATGFHVQTVSNGAEALEKMRQEEFDLLITDLLMPNMTGTELIEQARKLLPDLIAIVVTAHATLETAIQALQQGAYDYITKPFKPEVIIPVIERGLEKSRLQQKNAELTAITKKLQELEQIKSDLLDTITHEFSTPISIIKAYVDMFLDGHFDSSNPRHVEGLRSIRSAVIRLERLVMNLLTLSLGKGKGFDLKKEKILIQDIISNALSQLNEEITKKNINVVLNIQPDLPALDADPTKLSIAVLNLLDNAVKFNKTNGTIRISASILKSKSIGVAISDTGIGIPDDKLEEIYSPFTQVDMSSTRGHQGTGLGLAVAKSIIEAHGGKITLKSKLGKGSTFIFVIAH
ncbi:response regulator [candidate division KSB3 bacterium]|uniref:histidine kinase n=1 Tax=candidate division KSB3 bacterium TaxID=2044937 RepID=A0A9D5JZN2_9BACT|nr:response regulator [candidate division KSB3 bacterium]MBD3326726.1 response regulator [candidate division KSB3 bacterium]